MFWKKKKYKDREIAEKLFGAGFFFTEHRYYDYYIVGDEIVSNKPLCPFPNLSFEDEELKKECIKLLRKFKVPEFKSWDDFNEKEGDKKIEKFRRRSNIEYKVQMSALAIFIFLVCPLISVWTFTVWFYYKDVTPDDLVTIKGIVKSGEETSKGNGIKIFLENREPCFTLYGNYSKKFNQDFFYEVSIGSEIDMTIKKEELKNPGKAAKSDNLVISIVAVSKNGKKYYTVENYIEYHKWNSFYAGIMSLFFILFPAYMAYLSFSNRKITTGE